MTGHNNKMHDKTKTKTRQGNTDKATQAKTWQHESMQYNTVTKKTSQ